MSVQLCSSSRLGTKQCYRLDDRTPCTSALARSRKISLSTCYARARELMVVQQEAPLPSTSTHSAWGPHVIAGAITVSAAILLKSLVRDSKQCLKAEFGEAVFPLPVPDADPRAYQLALARSRQCMHVVKAVTHMKASDPARAMVEVNRALHENSICRSPLLDGRYSKEELLDLYRLHIKNSSMPPNFATLLQLRELLGLPRCEADEVEEEVMTMGQAFSI